LFFYPIGAEDIRQVREYFHPNSEPMIDWFHITARLTVLQQQRKAIEGARPEMGAIVLKQLESIKHLLWQGTSKLPAAKTHRSA
jgi:hypothetical protein